ncbi:uncharacterized protein VICG_00102 [Vittaforma corneae ATCC 50505]|uniref:DNA polymerase epsilon catalytic subunit n=1 Tax=Vittaforma corneae (strain ATCC 50505) TaxID=993615 RepID=L2GR40_VITCO|nr:uncharacterized protein VICG_00102 [Vittaforma corneae ATCC 50505]ELA42787.1 hypothetical protein VICG_00102 [Vittaforma corneae ATCC 50505]
MDGSNLVQESLLDLQFGYDFYYGFEPKHGWLLSYSIEKNKNDSLNVTFYFVDEFSNNFKVQVPYFPSIIVECKEELSSVEGYLKKRYEGCIQSTEVVEKIDVKEYNHLNKPPKKFLKLYFRTETSFQECIKNLKDVILESTKNRYKNEIYSDLFQEKCANDIASEIIQIHEYDIPYEIHVGNEHKIRCGCWYEISYDGESYKIELDKQKIAYPDLRIFAFDIETTKPPLKFPNPESDQVMMISIMTDEFGELITNRQIVSEDIQVFEYHAKDDMRCMFRVSNEPSEEALLIRFLEVILEHRPHIITTYNGSFFDWPFICKRLSKYNMNLFNSIQFKEVNEYFDCPFIIHLDCYKWVKRDSYLPMNNQGLKDVARIKLGYFPDEIDPEDMFRLASEDPQRLASYSVSDAVATYYLYLKYVHSHIFSVCSLIPLPPVQVLCKGAGTLCESLLLAESVSYKILVPLKKRTDGLEYYKGRLIENLTYVGGHVESLRAGIYRSDFYQEFNIDDQVVELIIDNLDQILEDYTSCTDYQAKKEQYICEIKSCIGKIMSKGCIYHLDVGAMYPNIILTNRLQPISVVNDDVCIRCDYNDEKNQCRKKMQWISRVEYMPPEANEINMIRNQLENETFADFNSGILEKVAYKDLPEGRRNAILKDRISEYSKKIYKRVKKVEENKEDIYICQREIPFYVETVRKFRDQRYVYKNLYKKAAQEYEKNPTSENKKNLVVYNSLQVAYKCILNSFYGYAMREGSRWFSLEMAATVCNVGGQIIRLAKELVEKIGMPLELDTDGIWGMLPIRFPHTISFNGKSVSVLSLILNYFVCKKFTNHQYQVANGHGGFDAVQQNSIFFELDGPYKTMVIPSSTEENKLLKKRYVVFNEDNKIVELKGFELKRRGELHFIKKFQEDIFNHFNDGTTLKECYDSLASICNYWMGIIDQQGGPLDDESIFYLFSESRNMSKSVESYANRKSNILSTAKRLSEFLGDDILEEKLKCEFIISKFPTSAPIVDRAIPVMIFRSAEKDFYLKKWLKTANNTDLRDILDWGYYRKRFENILQRLIVIPAYLQNIENPIPSVSLPNWMKDASKRERLEFSVVKDIEDSVVKKNLSDVFYTKNQSKKPKTNTTITGDCMMHVSVGVSDNIKTAVVSLKNSAFLEYIATNTSKWMEFYTNKLSFASIVAKVEVVDRNYVTIKYLNGKSVSLDFVCDLYLDVFNKKHFAENQIVKMYLPDQNLSKDLVKIQSAVSEVESKKYSKFLNHFSIMKTYNRFKPEYQFFNQTDLVCGAVDCVVISSFNYLKKPAFVITTTETFIVSDTKHPNVLKFSLKDFIDIRLKNHRVVVFSKADANSTTISDSFKNFYQLAVDVVATSFLETFENLIKIHIEFNSELKKCFSNLLDISKFAKIPIMNIDDSVLDLMLYRHFFRNGVMPVQDIEFSPKLIKDETHRSGYYNSYCIQFESSNSLILSILEYKATASDISLYHGYQRKDFQVFKTFLKDLVLNALRGNDGLKSLLLKIPYWAKKGSGIISSDLREVIEITHQRYNIGLVSVLKENHIKIVSASKDLMIIDTEKPTLDGCNSFVEYLKNKISSIPGYELLNLKVLRIFGKLGFVDQTNYFFYENNEFISGFSECKIPLSFLKLYFSDAEVKNEDVYSLVKHVDRKTLKAMLRLLSYKRDIHGLASNCYRLMRCSEFDDLDEPEFSLTVYCRKCGFENFLRKHCIKCYSVIDQEQVKKEASEYLKYCWKMQIFGNRFCNKCGCCEEKKLKEYCCCGGKLVKKEYLEDVCKIQNFVSSKVFDCEVEKFKSFFK